MFISPGSRAARRRRVASPQLGAGPLAIDINGNVLVGGQAFGFQLGMINGTLAASVASNSLTIAVKTLAGKDPSPSDPVVVVFRDAAINVGDYVVLSVTSAVSTTILASASLGTANNVSFRLWIVGFNDWGTLRLGIINCVVGAASPTQIAPLNETNPQQTAVPITGGAGSAGVLYSSDSASATITISNASPAVVTWPSHGLIPNQAVVFTTTGGLPTGLTAGVTYYVIAAGLTANTFEVALTPGGAAINASSAGSGTHTGHAGVFLKSFRILGYAEWQAGLPAAGAWSAGPGFVQLFGPGVKKPGDIVQKLYLTSNVASSSVTSSTYTPTVFSNNISPTSAANLVLIELSTWVVVNATNVVGNVAIFRGGTTRIGTELQLYTVSGGATQWPTSLAVLDAPGSTSPTNYSARYRNSDNATLVGSFLVAGANATGALILTEIMG